jgi:hypothetical protein
MLKFRTIAGVLCLLAATQAVAGNWRDQPDQTVETPVGRFTLTNLRARHTVGILHIEGELVNETNKTWDYVWVAIEMNDKNGKVTPKIGPSSAVLSADPNASGQFVARNLYPGARFKIKYQKDDVKADGNTLNFAYKYAYGVYPLTYSLALIKPASSASLNFKDDAITLAFVQGKTGLNFALQNNGDAPIKIDWNLVSFIQPGGTAQGVVHNGVKLIDRTAPKAPTMVPPHAKIEDSITPVDNIEWIENEWITDQLLPPGPSGLKLAGEEFSVFMPLDIGGATKNYSFVFKILSVQ